MLKTLAAKLVLPALGVFALSCDAQQSTSPLGPDAASASAP
jgi:hypothetical protein